MITLMSFLVAAGGYPDVFRDEPPSANGEAFLVRGVSSLCLFQKRLKGGLKRKVIWMLSSLGRGNMKKIVA